MPENFVRVEQVMDYLAERMETYKGDLGLEFIGYGDEQAVPRYPAIVIEGGPADRELHATQQFMVRWNILMWVYHARLSASHATRTKEDLELATRIVANLDHDFTLGGNVIFGFVASEAPTPINAGPSIVVVGTRLIWSGEARQSFPT
jgi:hypothetical protein